MRKPSFPLSPAKRRRARGMTLIELLVAMLVMTIGMVGLMTLMARASQATAGTEDTQRAALLAGDMANDMWSYSTINPPTVAAWQARVANASQSGLPRAVGAIVYTGQVARITVSWTTPTGASRQYFTDVRLN
ncbi:type IV pilus modification PilV family protein [Roseateles chitosanitabidus]|jgi:type IV pilus assembly protein PilV|uniref:type IV pilus modification PilV family protein n=1 Tax=Roseateles chitosanitabidus TaxID=65048 RepID=UPI000A02AD08|nr:prepilin-type N-terminal cleavage/methylation domain-containing protein [Roseateles chitosanitabidus]MBO9686990.1 prepilin-type N-terminal cleavage/methylation domain-containing protein [Roseateles chitosanitabidus]